MFSILQSKVRNNLVYSLSLITFINKSMDNIKISASFILPGSVLPAEQPCSKNGKKKKSKDKMIQKEPISYHTETIKVKQGTIVINVRDAKPVTQTMHLTQSAYDYMSSHEYPIYGINAKEWKNMSKTQRVKAHLLLIAYDLNGYLKDFTILED